MPSGSILGDGSPVGAEQTSPQGGGGGSLRIPVPWRRQPQTALLVLAQKWAARGVKAVVARGRGIYDTDGNTYAPNGTGIVIANGPAGIAATSPVNSTNTIQIAGGTSSKWATPTKTVTIFALVRRLGSTGGNSPLWGYNSPNGNTWSFQDSSGQLELGYSNGTLRTLAFPSGFTTGTLQFIAATYDSAVGAKLYSNGRLVNSAAFTGDISYVTGSDGVSLCNFFNYTGQNRSFNGEIYLAGMSPQVFTPQEIADLSLNPWQIFEDDIVEVPFPDLSWYAPQNTGGLPPLSIVAPWLRQPQRPVKTKTGGLAQGLIVAYNGATPFINLARPEKFVSGGAGALAHTPGPQGIALRTSATAWAAMPDAAWNRTSEVTVLTLCQRTGTLPMYASPAAKAWQSNSSPNYASWAIQYNWAGEGQNSLDAYSTGGPTARYTIPDSAVPHISGLRRTATTLYTVFNGKVVNSVIQAAIPYGASGDNDINLNSQYNAAPFAIYLTLIWNRALSDAEIKQACDNMWQIFEDDEIQLSLPYARYDGINTKIGSSFPVSVPRTRQPQGGDLKLKAGHSMLQGVSEVWVGSGASKTLIRRFNTTYYSSGSQVKPSVAGLALQHTNTTGNGINIGDPDDLLDSSECTIAMFRRCLDTAPHNTTAFGYNVGSTERVQAHVPYSDGNIYWDFGNDSTGRLSVAYTKDTKLETVVLIAGATRGREIWRRGVLLSSNASKTATRSTTSATEFGVGGTALNSSDNVEEYLFIVSKRAWTPTEIKAFEDNPWQIFEDDIINLGVSQDYVQQLGIAHTASIAETCTAVDSGDAVITYAVATAEAATATDAQTAAVVYVVADAESATATDTQAATAAFTSTIAESATATETSATTLFAAQNETATATDTQAVAVAFASAIAESATATETSATTLFASQSESATATDAQAPVVAFASTTDESATATEASATTLFASLSESTTATDAQAATVSLVDSLAESATATDSPSTTTSFVESTAESATATEASTRVLEHASAAAETCTASEASSAGYTRAADVSEATRPATDTPIVLYADYVAAMVESANSADYGTYGENLTETHTETCTATDACAWVNFARGDRRFTVRGENRLYTIRR